MARAVLLLTLGLAVSGCLPGCSMAMCVDGGPTFAKSFRLSFRFDDKALSGVTVRILAGGALVASVLSETDGIARVTGLTPGDYWLEAEKAGISAASFCFRVRSRWTPLATRNKRIEWGDFAIPLPRTVARFVDSQPGTEGTLLARLTKRVDVPIAGARISLLEPRSGKHYETTSSASGEFSFSGVADGTYVLQVSGGTTGRPYDAAHILVRLEKIGSTASDWELVREDYGGGACSDHGIRIKIPASTRVARNGARRSGRAG
ncbi:MAG TPA: carboxypeptidase regulatory-like domain-containing protein [Bryobacteraceae bacterium]|nr:carboxypeptidase regulatory-like domain-containing protein [Bryobacteraceae bacterium]